MKNLKYITIVSILLNVIFLIFGARMINGLGGIEFIKAKFSGKVKETEYQVLYKNKTAIQNTLPLTDKDILFIGDSLTDYSELSEMFPNANIKNRGIAGDDVQGVINRIDPMLAAHPHKIFLMVGVNNLIKKNTVEKTVSDYKALLTKIKLKSPNTIVYVESILPKNTQDKTFNDQVVSANEELNKLSAANQYTYVNLFDSFTDATGNLDSKLTEDGLHLNGVGYEVLKNQIQHLVSE